MSINHYSMDLPETTLWWPQQQQQQQQPILMEPTPNPSSTSWPSADPLGLNLNHQNDDVEEDEEEEEDDETTTTTQQQETEDEKEPMFEKPLTPSDVGKLNRLVIPKQHAEKYFPLSAGGDSAECKGLLLSFEDESGKCWRFRYSYWNSSQSYVLTKGWSRYVKDKRLDAGDVVLFERHRADAHRLFIGWRRRRNGDTPTAHLSGRSVGNAKSGDGNSKNEGSASSGGVGWTRGFYSAHPYPTHHHQQRLPYQHDYLHAGVTGRGSQSQGQKERTRRVGKSQSGSSSSRVLRLFGVNMECEPEHHHSDSGPSTPQFSSYNTPSTHFYLHHHHHQPYYY